MHTSRTMRHMNALNHRRQRTGLTSVPLPYLDSQPHTYQEELIDTYVDDSAWHRNNIWVYAIFTALPLLFTGTALLMIISMVHL